MQSKLTLSIKKSIIEKAKQFAKHSNRSLSEIIESYLEQITDSHKENIDHELSEVIGVITLPADFDDKKEARRIFTSKHS